MPLLSARYSMSLVWEEGEEREQLGRSTDAASQDGNTVLLFSAHKKRKGRNRASLSPTPLGLSPVVGDTSPAVRGPSAAKPSITEPMPADLRVFEASSDGARLELWFHDPDSGRVWSFDLVAAPQGVRVAKIDLISEAMNEQLAQWQGRRGGLLMPLFHSLKPVEVTVQHSLAGSLQPPQESPQPAGSAIQHDFDMECDDAPPPPPPPPPVPAYTPSPHAKRLVLGVTDDNLMVHSLPVARSRSRCVFSFAHSP
jgi:hypothetical protein